jgi:hypothetical protein
MCYTETLVFSCGCQSIETYACPQRHLQPPGPPYNAQDGDEDVKKCSAALAERLEFPWPCGGELPGGNPVLRDDVSRHLGPEPDLGGPPFYDPEGRLHKRRL